MVLLLILPRLTLASFRHPAVVVKIEVNLTHINIGFVSSREIADPRLFQNDPD